MTHRTTPLPQTLPFLRSELKQREDEAQWRYVFSFPIRLGLWMRSSC